MSTSPAALIAAMEESKKRIESAGGRATSVVADVRDTAQVQGLVDRAAEETGRLDIMVNNAGVSHPSPIIDADPPNGATCSRPTSSRCSPAARLPSAPCARPARKGHIVNISSVAAHRPDSGVYGSTKHAVNMHLPDTLRNELENDNIRVVTIMPGLIGTNFGRNFDPAVIAPLVRTSGVEVEVKRGERLPDEVFENFPPAMRQTIGNPEDVANAVLFAVSPADRRKRRRDRRPAAQAACSLDRGQVPCASSPRLNASTKSQKSRSPGERPSTVSTAATSERCCVP